MLHTLVISINQNKRKHYACALSSRMTWGKDPSAPENVAVDGMRGANQLYLLRLFFLMLPMKRGFSLSKLTSRSSWAHYRETEALTKWRITTMSFSVFWRTLQTGLHLKLSKVNMEFSVGITRLWLPKNIFCHLCKRHTDYLEWGSHDGNSNPWESWFYCCLSANLGWFPGLISILAVFPIYPI